MCQQKNILVLGSRIIFFGNFSQLAAEGIPFSGCRFCVCPCDHIPKVMGTSSHSGCTPGKLLMEILTNILHFSGPTFSSTAFLSLKLDIIGPTFSAPPLFCILLAIFIIFVFIFYSQRYCLLFTCLTFF